MGFIDRLKHLIKTGGMYVKSVDWCKDDLFGLALYEMIFQGSRLYLSDCNKKNVSQLPSPPHGTPGNKYSSGCNTNVVIAYSNDFPRTEFVLFNIELLV
jgi:hypothetical protein